MERFPCKGIDPLCVPTRMKPLVLIIYKFIITDFLCLWHRYLFKVCPICLPVVGSQIRISLSMLPVASFLPSGDQATQTTQLVWPLQVTSGVCVSISHSRRVQSPLPLANWRPSGLKAATSTASVWPIVRMHKKRTTRAHTHTQTHTHTQRERELRHSFDERQLSTLVYCAIYCSVPCKEAVHRVTERTRKMACGWYMIFSVSSRDMPSPAQVEMAKIIQLRVEIFRDSWLPKANMDAWRNKIPLTCRDFLILSTISSSIM